jgi:cytochrome P450
MSAIEIETTDFVDFDPFGQQFRRDPESWYPGLLDASPGFIMMEGIPSAYVAKQSQLTAVMRDFKRFSSVKPKGLPGMERVDFFNSQPVMNYSDPPTHHRLRRVVNAAFTPNRIAQMADATAAIIDDLLSTVEEGASIEVMSQIAKPMSVRLLLGEFLSVAEEDQPIFLRYLRTLPELDKVRPGEGKPRAFLDAWQEGVEYCSEAIARTRREKTDSLIGLIAAANDDGGTLSDQEMMAMMVVLFSGGISTVAAAAASSLLNIARTPQAAARVREDAAAAGPILEESMRLDPPVMLVMRFAAEDVAVGGATIRRGMPVYALLSAACHDPETWPDPYRFDIDRPNLKDHVAFGHGIHTCIGNAITRATVPRLVEAVATRFPNLRIADPAARLAWETTPRSRHLAAAQLTF